MRVLAKKDGDIMLIIPNDTQSFDDFSSPVPTSLALGRFDGVHLGHRQVIKAATDFDHALPAVFTFEQSPHGVLTGEMVYSLLTDSQKHEMIENLGIKLYVAPSFLSVKEMLPEEFLLMLKEKLNVVHIACGFNFTFGKFASGNPGVLKELCAKHNIELTVVPPVELDGVPVSSTAIRNYLANGDVNSASTLLGYRFAIDFPVIDGDKRGRTMDIPTINQQLPATFIHPRYGVYATKSKIGGKWYKSISNVGVRPTVGSAFPGCETYILDFDGDLYGKDVKVEFYDFMRDEIQFSDLDELKAAIDHDIDTVRLKSY